MIRVMIADDNFLVRQGLRLLLENAEGVTLVGEAQSGAEAIALIARHDPAVLLLDVSMPDMDGLTVVRTIRRENTRLKIIILTVHTGADLVAEAESAGADHVLTKTSSVADLTAAIHHVSARVPDSA